MNWSDVGKTVAGFAPLLGGVVGGPVGAGIGTILASAFGVEDNPDAVMQAIKGDPESAIKLQEIQLTHKAKLEEIKLQTTQAEIQDKQNARQENKHSIMPAVLSVALSFVIVGIIYLLFYATVPPGSKDVLFMLLGVVVKEWGGAMQYYFGTTRSSNEKTFMMRK